MGRAISACYPGRIKSGSVLSRVCEGGKSFISPLLLPLPLSWNSGFPSPWLPFLALSWLWLSESHGVEVEQEVCRVDVACGSGTPI